MSQINPHMFREYDIRGVYGEDLNEREAELIGKAFGTSVVKNGNKSKLALGRDHRVSSPALHAAFVKGVLSTGCNVVDYGVVPTPVLHWAILAHGLDGGACTTASHNPPEYNGFKLFFGSLSIGGQDIQKLRVLCETEAFATGSGSTSKRELVNEYISFMASRFKLKKKLKVVLDCGNGMACFTAPQLLRKIGYGVVELCCTPDGSFPNHLADPSIDSTLTELVAKVKSENAHVGIAFDGDGDRLGIVDENGKILKGDELTAIFSRQILLKTRGQKVVFDITCSRALEEDIANHSGVPIRWKTGHTNIELKLEEEKAALGGEMSGHLFFADHHYIDDAVYAACKFLEILSSSKVPSSQLLVNYPVYVNSPKIYIKTTDERKWKIVEGVAEEFNRKKFKMLRLDGVMAIFDKGWGLLRASNTSPSIVVRFEAKDEASLAQIKSIFTGALARQGVKLDE